MYDLEDTAALMHKLHPDRVRRSKQLAKALPMQKKMDIFDHPDCEGSQPCLTDIRADRTFPDLAARTAIHEARESALRQHAIDNPEATDIRVGHLPADVQKHLGTLKQCAKVTYNVLVHNSKAEMINAPCIDYSTSLEVEVEEEEDGEEEPLDLHHANSSDPKESDIEMSEEPPALASFQGSSSVNDQPDDEVLLDEVDVDADDDLDEMERVSSDQQHSKM